MNDHEFVFHGKNVDFDPGRAQRDGFFDGQQGVFRFMATGAPVGETDEPG